MTALASVLGELNDTWKAITAITGAVAFGATAISVFYGFTLAGVPAQTEQNAADIADLKDDMGSLVCLLTLTDRDTMSPQDMIRECGI